jgi:hypothetical protein
VVIFRELKLWRGLLTQQANPERRHPASAADEIQESGRISAALRLQL